MDRRKEEPLIMVLAVLFGALAGVLLSMAITPDISHGAIKRGWAKQGDAIYRIVPAEVR